MDPHPVVVRTYPTEIAAEIARAALNAHGIPALVQTSDAAGLLRATQGVQLVVRRDDLRLAREVLDAADDA
jgi:Putative prokaryotic signal transducing protein